MKHLACLLIAKIALFASCQVQSSEAFLVVRVDSKGYDYTTLESFYKKFSKLRTFGHAWIYLEGPLNGERVFFEGGQSGEFELPTYADELIASLKNKEPNAVSVLFKCREDGYFQWGSGGHPCSFAARFFLSEIEFRKILALIHPDNYSYNLYHLSHHQCVTFVEAVLSAIGIELDCSCQMQINPEITFNRARLKLWEDPKYASLQIATPEKLELALKKLVKENRAEKVAGIQNN